MGVKNSHPAGVGRAKLVSLTEYVFLTSSFFGNNITQGSNDPVFSRNVDIRLEYASLNIFRILKKYIVRE